MTEYIVNTFETRLDLSKEGEAFLDDYAQLYNNIKHKYYALTKKEKLNQNSRKDFLRDLGNPFPYRVFRGIEQTISGQEKSQRSNNKNYLTNKECQLDTLVKEIQKLQNRKAQGKSDKKEQTKLIKKQEKEKRLINAIDRLKTDKASHVCFGTRKLLKERSRCQTEEEITQWRECWSAKRNSEFLLVGSHDERYGNSQCQMVSGGNGYTIYLRTPYALENKHGYNLKIENIHFKYGDNHIQNTININQLVKDRVIESNGLPLSYRFKKDEKGWRVFVSVRMPKVELITLKKHLNGVLGVDINADHLAVTEVDKKGNYLNKWTFPLPLKTKTQAQRFSLIGDQVKEIIKLSLMLKKPIVIEDLDFSKKKKQLHKENPRYARMLSALSYQKIIQLVDVNCHKCGIELIKINPAYTSQLGLLKYKDRYGLSVHHSAAMVIARKGMGIVESTPKKLLQVKNNQCYTLIPPVRMGLSAMADYRQFFTWYGRFRTNESVMHFNRGISLLKAKPELHTSVSGVIPHSPPLRCRAESPNG